MSKPDWKHAPDWANWLARDQSGDWYWYTGKPKMLKQLWTNSHAEDYCECASMAEDEEKSELWSRSLESRPGLQEKH